MRYIVTHCETAHKPLGYYLVSYHDAPRPDRFSGERMAKTEFLQIRVAPDDLARIRKAAEEDHLEASTWARRVLLRAVEAVERHRTRPDPKFREEN